LSASFTLGGVRVDHGSHRLHPSTPPAIIAALRDLLGPELQTRPRHGRIRLFGRWVDFPLRPLALARSLPPGFLVRAGGSAAMAALRPARSGTFAEHVSSGLGRVMGEEFYFPYARKIWGIEPDRIAGEQARRRVSAATPTQLLARITSPADDAGRTFWYPAGGFGRISEVLSEAAKRAGAAIRLGHAVETLRQRPDGTWVLQTASGPDIHARHVWSSVPVTLLSRLVGFPPPSLRYRAMLLVYLVLQRPVGDGRYTPYDAHYLPSADTPVTRISEPANYRDSAADPLDRTVLCAEIPCDRTDAMWSAPQEHLQDMVLAALRRSGLPVPAISEVAVRRVPFAYPVYEIGYERALQPLLERIDGLAGLLTFGRQGLFAHDNTHHALAMAWAAADCLSPDGNFDSDRWRRARDRFAEHVVSD